MRFRQWRDARQDWRGTHVFIRMPGEFPVRKATQVIPVVICQLGTFELANSCDTGDVSLGAINVTLLKKHQIPW